MSLRLHTSNRRAWLLVVLLGLALTGCGSDDPTGPSGTPDPDPDPEEIRTPVQFRLNTIEVSDFAEKKGLVTWDASISVGPRAPDIYVTVQVGSTSVDPIHVSTVREDAFTGVAIYHDMSSARSGQSLPKTISASSTVYITLWDDDGLSPDDEMGVLTFDPLDLYLDDNATGFTRTLAGTNESEFRIRGTWVY